MPTLTPEQRAQLAGVLAITLRDDVLWLRREGRYVRERRYFDIAARIEGALAEPAPVLSCQIAGGPCDWTPVAEYVDRGQRRWLCAQHARALQASPAPSDVDPRPTCRHCGGLIAGYAPLRASASGGA